MPIFLGIDAGTTSMKAALFDLSGRALAVARAEYALDTPAPAVVECDAEVYWSACCRVVREALTAARIPADEVATVAISSQAETLIAVDAAGRPLRPAIVWLDNRAVAEAAEFRDRFGEEAMFRLSGQPEAAPTWPACKLLWLRRNEPHIFDAAAKFLLLEDFLLHRLTGEFVTEHSLQTSSYMLDITRREWWQPVLDYLGVGSERLGRLVAPGALIGPLSAAGAEAVGLTTRTQAVASAIDQCVGALGAGNAIPGVITETTGAALAVVATIDRPYFDPRRRLPCYCHALPGLYCLLPWGQTAGMALRWFRDEFYPLESERARENGVDSYDQMTAEAARVPPGSDGLLALPHLEGAFTPEYNASARGAFFGATLRTGRGHFTRALMESVAFMLKRQVDLVEEMGFPVSEVRSIGGGAASPLWLQIKADVLGKPLRTVEASEPGCLGAAVLGALATGCYGSASQAVTGMVRTKQQIDPERRNAQAYAEAFTRYCELYDRLAPMFQ
jgi:xylulokinase